MVTLTVNGRTHQSDADPSTPLLYVLRDDLKLNGAKFGCGLGQCGACTVFIAEQAAQCGYCIAGMIMRAHALLQKTSAPSDEQIRGALEPHLCRCGTHMRILRAVRRAAQETKSAAVTGTRKEQAP